MAPVNQAGLRLIESAPAPDHRREMAEAARALARARCATRGKAEYKHEYQMMGHALSLAEHSGACSRAALLGIRLVEDVSKEPPAAELLDAAEEAIRALIDTDYPEVTSAGAGCFEGVADAIARKRSQTERRAERSEVDAEWDLYRKRWCESDLPSEPELRASVKRELVRGGYWTIAQLSDAGPRAIRGVNMVGPKALEQISALLTKRDLPFGEAVPA